MAYAPPRSPYGSNNEDYFTPLPSTQSDQAYHRPQRQQSQYNSTEEVYNMYAQAHPHGQEDYSQYETSIHSNHSRTHLNPQPFAPNGPTANYPPLPTQGNGYPNQQTNVYPNQQMPQRTSPPSPYYNPSPPQWSPAKSPYMGNPGAVDPSYFNQSSAYGQTRQKVLNRRSVRQVELQQGNLVLDCPVPSSILTYAKDWPGSGPDEFKKMRYTAVTCDPDDFITGKYTLRPYLYGRKTEMAIVVTMYNEDEFLFCRTMTSVIKNIQHLVSKNRSKTWGPDAWKKVVVVIVSDGRAKVNKRTLSVLGLMGVYQDGIAKDTMAGRDVQAHVFEYTTQVVVDELGNVSGGIAPVQIVFCLKEQNKKKLNSHRWFFNAFCAQLNPNVCILIDAGTKPSGTSLHALYKCFEKNKNVGGCCGEITVDVGRGCSNLLNPLVASQNFEYKMSNILDKPTESVFGYISVLPGAFSAYRYKALLNSSNGKGPLASYFLGEKMHEPGASASVFEGNMYLAEDRILCFEIVTKKREAWVLRYVKSAKASTDVPNKVDEFIGQRRRWLNGSFFAAVHATIMFHRIWTSGHNIFRKLWLTIEFLYNAINLFFTWTALANFYLALFFVFQASISVPTQDPFGGQGDDVTQITTNVYVGLLFVILVCSLGNRPSGSKFAYTTVIILFAAIFGIALYCAAWTIYLAVPHTAAGWKHISTLLEQSGFRDIVISLGATYGLYFITSFLHAEPWHMFTCFIQYMLLLPSWVNILSIYSFSNLHDLSWGTKGQNGPAKDLGGAKKTGKEGKEAVEVEIPTQPEDINQLWMAMRKDLSVKPLESKQSRDANQKIEDHFRNYRTNILLAYVLTNVFFVLFFTSKFFSRWVQKETGISVSVNPYESFIFWSVAGLSAFRAFGSIMYLILRIFGH